MERLTKYMPNEKRYFYRGELIENITKLGQLEDILEKHNVKSLEELDNKLDFVEMVGEDLSNNVFLERTK